MNQELIIHSMPGGCYSLRFLSHIDLIARARFGIASSLGECSSHVSNKTWRSLQQRLLLAVPPNIQSILMPHNKVSRMQGQQPEIIMRTPKYRQFQKSPNNDHFPSGCWPLDLCNRISAHLRRFFLIGGYYICYHLCLALRYRSAQQDGVYISGWRLALVGDGRGGIPTPKPQVRRFQIKVRFQMTVPCMDIPTQMPYRRICRRAILRCLIGDT